jgi:hypothetical protein
MFGNVILEEQNLDQLWNILTNKLEILLKKKIWLNFISLLMAVADIQLK